MLRKLMLIGAAFALTGCISATGPADFTSDVDPESEQWVADPGVDHAVQIEEPAAEIPDGQF